MAPSNFVHASGTSHGIPAGPHGSQSTDAKTAEESQTQAQWYQVFRTNRNNSTAPDPEKGHHDYRNVLGEIIHTRNQTDEQYLSTTRNRARRLLVQASRYSELDPNHYWKRQSVQGFVPTALKISEWTLRPAFPKRRSKAAVRWVGIPSFILRTLIVALPLQLYMSFPIFTPPWDEDEAEDTYLDWPGYHWTWPRFAVNPLDMSPDSPERITRALTATTRLLRPRQLMVLEQDGRWTLRNLEEEPLAYTPYVMVSYANHSFHTSPRPGEPAGPPPEEGREILRKVARTAALSAGLKAYWMDFECREDTDGELKDADVNRFCDVIRGSHSVVIALPDSSEASKLVWGKRMWTLPEGLLAPGNSIDIHYCDSDTVQPMTKVEMATTIWSQSARPRQNGADLEATRLLAEHFTGTLQLSRLQLMATALSALWDRKDPEKKEFTHGELSYALMGLLHSRIDHVKGNSLFQDIAKLSLLNDSDQLIERMICLLPRSDTSDADTAGDLSNDDPFRMLQREDEYNTHLWDITPSCQVVGVDEQDRTVILNETRAIALRWKKFPKILFKRSGSFKKFVAELFLRSGAWWFITGFGLIWTYTPFWATPTNEAYRVWLGYAIAFFFAFGSLLSLLGPISMRVLYGGVLLQPAPHLVGFEGFMPIEELEKIIFGNDDGRLSYEPSSTPFAKDWRDARETVGVEPKWVTDNQTPALKPGHRLFTLVDTGSLTVSIFQAKNPPTVALICGREGGMLRTVLCSWRSSTDCLYKETVMRMPTEIYDMATSKGWLKLQLDRDYLLKAGQPTRSWSTR